MTIAPEQCIKARVSGKPNSDGAVVRRVLRAAPCPLA
jgi:hypothetical protein